jgi:hypothetical protein
MPAKIGYGRKIVYKDKNVEVVLITWPKNSRSLGHDHGRSVGLIRVLSGQVYQDVYSKKTKKFIKRINYKVGDSIVETPALLHVMGNSSQKRTARALHIYTPPVKMRYYEDKVLKK